MAVLQLCGYLPLRYIKTSFLLVALGQTLLNAFLKQIPDRQFSLADKAITNRIIRETGPADKLVVWGHADRFYVMAKRSMGSRLADNWWIVHQGPTQAFRIKEFISDLEKNRPALLVDNTNGPDPHRFQFPGSHLFSIPEIARYVKENYHLVGQESGALFYKRNPG